MRFKNQEVDSFGSLLIKNNISDSLQLVLPTQGSTTVITSRNPGKFYFSFELSTKFLQKTKSAFFVNHRSTTSTLLLILSILLSVTFTANAQICRVKGSVVDSSSNGIPDASLTLLRKDKKTFIKSELSAADGSFSFLITTADTFLLYVRTLEGITQESPEFIISVTDTAVVLPTLIIRAVQKQLQEVTVFVALPTIERKADRTIFHPENLVVTAGGSAYDVVLKAPGVTADQNNAIRLSGKPGVLVYIDDKRVYLDGTELEQYLRSIPGSQIKQVEIIKNPPARYDAAGNAGIINIVTKKTRLPGINGFVSANYAQGRYARSNNSGSLNYTGKKLALYSNFGGSIFHTYQDLVIYRNYLDANNQASSSFTQRTYINIRPTSVNLRLAADYYLSDKTTLGVSAKLLGSPSTILQNNRGEIISNTNVLQSTVLAHYKNNNSLINGTYNLNLRHKIDTLGRELTVDADYVTYNSGLTQQFGNTQLNSMGGISYNDLQNGNLISAISIAAIKADYTTPLGKKNAKLDVGAKLSSTETDNESKYTINLDGTERINDLFSNHFKYAELIGAAYSNFVWSGKKIDVQAGLRFEGTQLKAKQFGNSLNPPNEFGRNYNSLFPTLYLTYRADSAAKHIFTFYSGRRIDRPYYSDLNPFISPLDKFTYYSGNPYLRPSFTNNVGLSYSFANYFTLNVGSNYADNQINETIEIKDGIYYSRPGNIGKTFQLVTSIESSQSLTKWWTLTAYSEVNYSHFQSRLYTQTLNSRGTYWYINLNNTFPLGKGWSAEFNAQYISKITETQFVVGDFGHLSCGLQKKMLKDKGSLKLAANDLLHSDIRRGTINNLDQTTAGWYSVRDTRVVSATFSYRFGKTTGGKQRHNSTGSEDEQKRVKT